MLKLRQLMAFCIFCYVKRSYDFELFSKHTVRLDRDRYARLSILHLLGDKKYHGPRLSKAKVKAVL